MHFPLLPRLLTSIAVAGAGDASYDTIDGHPCIRSMEGMKKSMHDLAAAHPNLVSITNIGESFLKKYPDDGKVSRPKSSFCTRYQTCILTLSLSPPTTALRRL